MARRTTELTIPLDLPALWQVQWQEDRWPRLTDRIEQVDVLDGGDRHGNSRLRRIHQHRRWWDATVMIERTERVAHHRSIDAVVHHHRVDVRHGWRLEFEPVDRVSTRLRLDEEVIVDESRYPTEARRLCDRLLGLRPALFTAMAQAPGPENH